MVTMVFCTMFAYVGWSSRDTRAPVAPTICRCWTVRGDAIIQCAPFALQKSMKNVFAPLRGCVLERSACCIRLDMDQDVVLQVEPRVVDVAMMLNDVVFFVHSHVPCKDRWRQTPNSHHLLYRKRPFRGEALHWDKKGRFGFSDGCLPWQVWCMWGRQEPQELQGMSKGTSCTWSMLCGPLKTAACQGWSTLHKVLQRSSLQYIHVAQDTCNCYCYYVTVSYIIFGWRKRILHSPLIVSIWYQEYGMCVTCDLVDFFGSFLLQTDWLW